MTDTNKFFQALSDSPSITEAKQLFDSYLNGSGFSHYAFTYYSGHIKTGRRLQYHCVSSALRPWHEFYIEQGYADVDRTLETNNKMVLPLFWEVSEQITQAKNTRERRMRQEAMEYGIDKGLSIPIHGPNNDFSTLTLHQVRGESCLKNYHSQQYLWQSMTLVFYHHVRRLLGTPDTSLAYHLTKREKQCLDLTAKLWRVEQIAKELHISERTVNYHLQNANKKLGTNSKYLSIYKYLDAS